MDVGIQSMVLMQTPQGPLPAFAHAGLDRLIPYLYESEGTRQFFNVYPYIWSALGTGGIAVLDELDSTIHPMLLPEILRWFYDLETNKHGAQLWMSGQSASLLEVLHKEEVFFTEKDDRGRTKIYGLTDIESVRRSDNFYQKYLGGVYGAVPRIG
jgi:predicted ATPase